MMVKAICVNWLSATNAIKQRITELAQLRAAGEAIQIINLYIKIEIKKRGWRKLRPP